MQQLHIKLFEPHTSLERILDFERRMESSYKVRILFYTVDYSGPPAWTIGIWQAKRHRVG
jgi:hypothetical protein